MSPGIGNGDHFRRVVISDRQREHSQLSASASLMRAVTASAATLIQRVRVLFFARLKRALSGTDAFESRSATDFFSRISKFLC